jgi:hypothetical protein
MSASSVHSAQPTSVLIHLCFKYVNTPLLTGSEHMHRTQHFGSRSDPATLVQDFKDFFFILNLDFKVGSLVPALKKFLNFYLAYKKLEVNIGPYTYKISGF